MNEQYIFEEIKQRYEKSNKYAIFVTYEDIGILIHIIEVLDKQLKFRKEELQDNTEEIKELETIGYITTGGDNDIKDFVKKTNKVITDNFYLVNEIIENQNKLVRAVNKIRRNKNVK